MSLAALSGCVSGTPEQHLLKGAERFQQGDTAAAIREFKDALWLNRSFAPAYYNLGICYSTAKTRDKAIGQFARAVQCDPRYADAYIALAQAYVRKDTLDAAIALLRRGLAQGLAPLPFYENLGFCFMRRSAKDSALHYYQLAVALDSNGTVDYFNIGYLLSAPQQSDSSIKYLRLAHRHAANKHAVSFLLGTRLLDKPGRSAAETREGIAMLEDYLANGDHEAMKVSKANELIAKAKQRR
ncbi:MAG TPA: hypothetical protein VMF29_05575 [Candidatus Edwardsbacteria bacterium]|nr:hypothetical protein [Candidatus Edwardsbacteria bacterium]